MEQAAAPTVVFMHVGPDAGQPAMMVASVRRHNPGATIIQMTDQASPEVAGVDQVGRATPTHANTVLFRVELFSALPVRGPTWFFDTDMLCHRPLAHEDPQHPQVSVCVRELRRDALFNPQSTRDDFNELAGKTMGEAFPYVACATLTHDPEFWPACLEILRRLPAKYHFWYGDQEAIRRVVESGRFRVGALPERIYGCLPEFEDPAAPPVMTHYKGLKRKPLMLERAIAEGIAV